MPVDLERVGGNDGSFFQQEAVEVAGKEKLVHEVFEIGYILKYMKFINLARDFQDRKVEIFHAEILLL